MCWHSASHQKNISNLLVQLPAKLVLNVFLSLKILWLKCSYILCGWCRGLSSVWSLPDLICMILNIITNGKQVAAGFHLFFTWYYKVEIVCGVLHSWSFYWNLFVMLINPHGKTGKRYFHLNVEGKI